MDGRGRRRLARTGSGALGRGARALLAAATITTITTMAGCAAAPEPSVRPPRAAGADEVRVRRAEAGASVEGRPIRVDVLGHGPDCVLVLASIHGDEPAGTPLVHRLREHLSVEPAPLEGRTVVLVPVANPDGLARRRRSNARGVDLNRDFPTSDRAAGHRAQPETRAIVELVRRYAPSRIVSLHQPLACIDWDGPGEALARTMAAACDLRARKLGARRGSLGSWAGVERGAAVVTVELPAAATRDDAERLWSRYGAMLLAAVAPARAPLPARARAAAATGARATPRE